MFNFLQSARTRVPNLVSANKNGSIKLPLLTLQVVPGQISTYSYDNNRDYNFIAIFTSYANDIKSAYNEIVKLQENILADDFENYIVPKTEISDIIDLSFIESGSNIYRYEWRCVIEGVRNEL